MEKKTGGYLKKIGLKFLSVSCPFLLLISLLSLTASGENAIINGKTSASDKISPSVSSKMNATSDAEQIPVIVVLNNQNISYTTDEGKFQIENEQKGLKNFLEGLESGKKVQKMKTMHIVNAIAVKATPEVIASLAKRPDVSRIELDKVVSIVDGCEQPHKAVIKARIKQINAWGVDKIGTPAVWQRGITGKGITVAVIDSGIDTKHPDLDDLDDNPFTRDPKVVGWIDYINGRKSPYDDYGHGTNVAGVISGTGESGVHTGVAPGTKLIGAKVYDEYGFGYQSDVILAFEWAVNNGARIINFSGGEPEHNSSFTIALDRVVRAGVIPVIAAGNSGPDSDTIDCPGDELNSTTVGATDISDAICIFSSRGPVELYGQRYFKPDVCAPGLEITSTATVKSGNLYENVSGTSMAAPYVSGTAALMLERNPTLKPSMLKNILESTAMDLGPKGKDNDYGSGRINAYQSVFVACVLPAL